MKRRVFIEFIAAFAASLASPVVARAQAAAVRTIGYLSSRSQDVETEFIAAFRRGLSETGHLAGKSVQIEYRWAEGLYEHLPKLAADLVQQGVSVIATTGGVQSVRAALGATREIPIVFTSGSDPVKDGLVRSINRPGGNITGVHVFTTSLGPKRLEVLRELVPSARVVAFIVNPSSPSAQVQVKEVEDASRAIGLAIRVFTASTAGELEAAFASAVEQRIGAALMSADLLFQVQREQLVALAARHSIPVMYEWPEFVAAGGLISYATIRSQAFLQWGIYVGRILNGANPAELPIVQSTHFALTINLSTARALGIEVPPMLLALADEVIE